MQHRETELVIRGAGGGKGSGGGGTEQPDTLRSTQVADVLDLISEGEIEGLVSGLKSVYLDEVPLQNADGSYNFEGVQVQLTAGTQGQPAITGADGVQSEVAVAVAVKSTTPVTRTITTAGADKVRVTLEVPQLTRQDLSNGDLVGSSFGWAVDVQSNGGGFVRKASGTVDGKTTSRYNTAVDIELTGSAPWDVKVVRTTPDSTSAAEVNEFRWSSYTVIQSLKLRYPNSAMVRTRVNAQQFSRVPVRAFDILGRRVRVPTNYDPLTKAYTGVWDGTFKTAWTDCPAWVFYDMVTNTRFGLGRYFPVTDSLKWELYAIGRYCDAMVPDGKGGYEPRFKCGLYLTTREQAYKVLTDLAAIFRGMAYWGGTDMAVVQDAPADLVAVFTAANVVDGVFTYVGASNSKRYSQVVVWFNDPAQFGKLAPEVVVDRALTARIGIKSLELSPLGIWSRGQAQRLGKWALYSQQAEGQTVTFRVGLDGALVAPGRIFAIADPNEAGERLGGRVRTATSSVVTLDAAVELRAGETYTLTAMVQDAADPARLVAETKAVTNAAGAGQQAINVSPAFSSAPAPGTVWVLQSTAVQATTWRCLAVTEVDGANQFEIAGIRHEPGKYDLIEQGIAFEAPSVSRIKRVPDAPASLSFTETVYTLRDTRRSRVTVSWPEPAAGLSYLVSWRLSNGPWTEMPAVQANCVDIDALAPGALEVAVKSRNALGALSTARQGGFTVVGWQGAIGANLIDPSWWKPGASWEWQIWPANAAGGAMNAIVWGAGPRGAVQAVWEATYTGADGVAGGGFDGSRYYPVPKNSAAIDPTKTYRFSLPVMQVAGSSFVKFDCGYNGASVATRDLRVCTLNTSTLAIDVPFYFSGLPVVGRWYLLVAYVYPAGSTGVAADAGGLYDMTTGDKLASVTNFCWAADARDIGVGAFHASSTAGSRMRFAPPAIELVDGTDGAWTAGPRGPNGVGAFTLVARGSCTVPAPDRVVKGGSSFAWDSDANSAESFVDGAFFSFQAEQTNKNAMVGFVSNVASAPGYASIDCSWQVQGNGRAAIIESGVFHDVGPYTVSTILSGVYDGYAVRYYLDGSLVREVTVPEGTRFYLRASEYEPGTGVRNVRFGPAGKRGPTGAQGPQGPQGTPGAAGANGLTPYFHIAYASNSTGTVGFNQSSGPYIGTYWDYNPTDSSNPAAYTWRQFVGSQGPQGIPGSNGTDGQTGYLHLKYSNNGGVSFTGNAGEDPGTWLGQYFDFTPADSNNPAAYTWSKIEGPQGPQGPQGNAGAQGPRGSLSASRAVATAAWSDSEAAAAISAAGGGPPRILDLVTLYLADGSWSQARVYDGSAWQPYAARIDGNLLVLGSVYAGAIQIGAVTKSQRHFQSAGTSTTWPDVSGLSTFSTDLDVSLTSTVGHFMLAMASGSVSIGAVNSAVAFIDGSISLHPFDASGADLSATYPFVDQAFYQAVVPGGGVTVPFSLSVPIVGITGLVRYAVVVRARAATSTGSTTNPGAGSPGNRSTVFWQGNILLFENQV